jgi:hypothetical protein
VLNTTVSIEAGPAPCGERAIDSRALALLRVSFRASRRAEEGFRRRKSQLATIMRQHGIGWLSHQGVRRQGSINPRAGPTDV